MNHALLLDSGRHIYVQAGIVDVLYVNTYHE